MNKLFLLIVNMSIAASWLILAVMILRIILKKAPKWIRMLLWGIVGIRLICPVVAESPFSMIPSARTLPEKLLTGPSFRIQTGLAPMDSRINDYLGDNYFEGVTVPTGSGRDVMTVLAAMWLAGMCVFVGYIVISWLRLRYKIRTAVWLQDNIFQSENIGSAFVLGIMRPRIYVPFDSDIEALKHVIAHEQAHIRRKDHWWKIIGFLLLMIHWFNPFVWASYRLLCRDIELACDETVIRHLKKEQKAEYAQALLKYCAPRFATVSSPLAFGEVGIKARIRSVMNYKQPAARVLIAAVILCAATALCFLTNPVRKLEWVTELSSTEIRQVNMIIMPQNPDKQFKRLSEKEVTEMVELFRQCRGRYLIFHPDVTGGGISFDISMKDGSRHNVENIGNIYLVVDGAYYKADYEWLASWEREYGEGDTFLPADYYQ